MSRRWEGRRRALCAHFHVPTLVSCLCIGSTRLADLTYLEENAVFAHRRRWRGSIRRTDLLQIADLSGSLEKSIRVAKLDNRPVMRYSPVRVTAHQDKTCVRSHPTPANPLWPAR